MTDLSPGTTLFAATFHDPEIAALFSADSFARAMLHTEAVLARAEVRLGVIPADAAQRIEAAAETLPIDFEHLQARMEKDGFPIIELVRQLREAVGGEAASYVHWGATTQDIIETALVLQTRTALGHIEGNLHALIRSLARLAAHHRRTLMAGRTHSQQALPIPFGLKAAGWLAPLLRHRQRLAELRPRALVVQFGGAAGTLASLGGRGIEVQAALAAELDLGVPLMPWHTQRDTLAEVAGWLSVLTGGLAKMAQDIILLKRLGARNRRPITRRVKHDAAEEQPITRSLSSPGAVNARCWQQCTRR
jgi:3-carboxy-cis,cis-muconate cycloisomerase